MGTQKSAKTPPAGAKMIRLFHKKFIWIVFKAQTYVSTVPPPLIFRPSYGSVKGMQHHRQEFKVLQEMIQVCHETEKGQLG